ncbi:MAG TPA: hypothetical protein VF334_23765 [Polyangia bacterium]
MSTFTVRPPWYAAAVWAFGEQDVVAAGTSGRRWHNGRYVPDGSQLGVRVMSAVGSDNVYALGYYESIEHWVNDDPPTIEHSGLTQLLDIWAADASHIFAGGFSDASPDAPGGEVWFSSGDGQWTQAATILRTVIAIRGSAADDVFAVGSGIAHLTGGTWRNEPTPADHVWNSVWATRTTTGQAAWVGGDDASNPTKPYGDGIVARSAGDGQWTESRIDLGDPVLWGTSEMDLYIAEGNWVGGACKFRRWDGASWVPFPSPPGCTRGILAAHSVAPGDFFVVVDGGHIGHFWDGAWTVIDPSDPGETMTVTETGRESVAIDGYTSCSLDPR